MRARKTLRLSVGIAKALEQWSERTGRSEGEIADIALAEHFAREMDGVLKEYAEMRVRAAKREIHQELQTEHVSAMFHVSRIEEMVLQMVNERTITKDEIAIYLRAEIAGLCEHLHPSRVEASQIELGEYLVMLDKGEERKLLSRLRERIKERRKNMQEFLQWPTGRSTRPQA